MIWSFHIVLLLVVRVTEGFTVLPFPYAGSKQRLRWQICFNLTLLRMISFALDFHWYRRRMIKIKEQDVSYTKRSSKSHSVPPGHVHIQFLNGKERQRMELPSEDDYSILFMVAHSLYPPLYLAGPIITYQDFVWQLKGGTVSGRKSRMLDTTEGKMCTSSPCSPRDRRSTSGGSFIAACDTVHSGEKHDMTCSDSSHPAGNSARRQASDKWLPDTLRYTFRFFADVLCLEFVTHFLYFNSIAVHRIGPRYRQHGLEFDAQHIGLTGWWVLCFMWLKFATIWRFFRYVIPVHPISYRSLQILCGFFLSCG